jgi:hypothetical protein
MEKPQLIIEAFKLLHDWSKWLIALEAAICASLWPKLTGTPKPSIFPYLGWMMFLGSIWNVEYLISRIRPQASPIEIPGVLVGNPRIGTS